MTALFGEIAASMPPLRGVIHTAAVLDDGVLAQQTWPRFVRVLAPKAAGTVLLDRHTASLPLDFFILFSSIAAVAGAPGQASYAAANAIQDAFAHARRRRGLPATSINWGAWAEGLSAKQGLAQRREELGITDMRAEEGLRLLDYILLEAPAQITAGFFDWTRFARRYPGGALPPRLAGLLDARLLRPVDAIHSAAGKPGLLDLLATAPESGRVGILREHVQTLAARILGFDAGRRMDGQQPLGELGLDSLMAVEFRNALSGATRQTLPSVLLFSYPTIDDLTAFLADRLFGGAPALPAEALRTGGSQLVWDSIEELSDEEVDRLLEQRTGVSR
jgi:polyketide synthase 12/myxalamid-type polyketide synthase MxaB